MAKVLIFGKDANDLSSMSTEEFISKYAKSRSRRVYERIAENPEYKTLLAKVKKYRETKSKNVIKTHVREAVILPEWIGLKFGIHNGKEFVTIEIIPQMVGRRLGDFSHTTKRVAHSGPGVGATRGSKFVPLK
jgi:small subunit ribosomal protein S19